MDFDWARGDVIVVDGTEVARAERSWLRERAEVQIGPELWHYRAEGGWTRSSLVAEVDGVARFTARRSSLFSTTWTVDAAGDQLEVASAGFFGTRLVVKRAGTVIGEVSRSGIFTTRTRLETSTDLDVPLGCFLLWVAYVELNRRQSSAGSSSAAVS
ncbi:hypothetical protein NOCA1170007 [metagenome]|uniref:Uncharacterized protein n=1 Tax=metagenome TaxID=256318 RepID=A0A2P2CAL6_9ZZZZ